MLHMLTVFPQNDTSIRCSSYKLVNMIRESSSMGMKSSAAIFSIMNPWCTFIVCFWVGADRETTTSAASFSAETHGRNDVEEGERVGEQEAE